MFVKPQVPCMSRLSLHELFFVFLQNKCVPYWPEPQSSKEVGPYVVTSESEREATDYKVRVLQIAPVDRVTSRHQPLNSLHSLISAHVAEVNISQFHFTNTFFWSIVTLFFTLSQPKHSRTIWHYQYLSWPDHGVPQEPGGVLSFLTQVHTKQAECPDAGPMIIHCRYRRAWDQKPQSTL